MAPKQEAKSYPRRVLLRKEQEVFKLLAKRNPDCDRIGRIVEELAAVPGAAETCQLGPLYGEWGMALIDAGRYEEAIGAIYKAREFGWERTPDSRSDIAECHLQLGNREQADALYAQLREEYPDDVWLFNNAGFAYHLVKDHEVAVEWLTEGIELALRTDDPEHLLDQLSDLRRAGLKALNRPLDELEARVDEFLQARAETVSHNGMDSGDRFGGFESGDGLGLASRGAHRLGQGAHIPDGAVTVPGPGQTVKFAAAWFPRSELEEALERWPEWRDIPEKRTYDEHRAAVQRLLLQLAGSGTRPDLAPIYVSQFVEWAAAEGKDPSKSATIALFASHQAKEGNTIPWPPGRNDRCWCGSGRKYKQCCLKI